MLDLCRPFANIIVRYFFICLLVFSPLSVFTQNRVENTPNIKQKDLIEAVIEGRVIKVKKILKDYPNINVDAQSDSGVSLLMLATVHGHKNIVDLLIKKNADVNLTDNKGLSALIIASTNKDRAIVSKLLLAGAEVNKNSSDGYSALMVAAYTGHLPSVTTLLKAGADVNLQNKEDGLTALIIASAKGYNKIVKALLDAGADINIRNKRGFTALDEATKRFFIKTMRILKNHS